VSAVVGGCNCRSTFALRLLHVRIPPAGLMPLITSCRVVRAPDAPRAVVVPSTG
jgi:hypothetical protein